MSYLACPKGCVRHAVRHASGLAFAVAGQQKSARRVAIPPEARAEYDAMVARTPLHANPPLLEFYDDLHGVGGMFIPAAWAIIIGMKDQEDIAARVRQNWPNDLALVFREVNGRAPVGHELVSFTFQAAVGRCMAHELGHALIRSGSVNPYAPDEEAGADYYAGRFDAAFGRNRKVGAMFFYSIGCVGPSCTHPAPATRAGAHAAGFAAQHNGS